MHVKKKVAEGMIPSPAKGHLPDSVDHITTAAITIAARPGPASSNQAAARIAQGNKKNCTGWNGRWKIAYPVTRRQPIRIGPIRASRLRFQSFQPARADSSSGM